MTHKIFIANVKLWWADMKLSSQKCWWFQLNIRNGEVKLETATTCAIVDSENKANA